jgi:hypothetical protein
MKEITYIGEPSTKFLCGPRRFQLVHSELLIPIGPFFQLQIVFQNLESGKCDFEEISNKYYFSNIFQLNREEMAITTAHQRTI